MNTFHTLANRFTTYGRAAGVRTRYIAPFLALLTVLAAPDAAHAQQQQREERFRNDLNLPTWSRPSSPTSGQTLAAARQQSSSGTPTPHAPSQAPLGGVEWLALAGGAYAIRRLRQRMQEND